MSETVNMRTRCAGLIYALSSTAICSFSVLLSVSSWFYNTGIGIEHGRYLMRKGTLVIDPGQTFGLVLYVLSKVLIGSVIAVVVLVIILLNDVGRVEEFKEVFRSESLRTYRRVFQVAALSVAVPFIVQLLSWAFRY